MDYFTLAYDAIEAVVKVTFPESSNKWSAIKPMDNIGGWGLELAAWATVAKRIEAEFNARIKPLTITVAKPAILKSGGEALDLFQQYLAEKADAAALKATAKASLTARRGARKAETKAKPEARREAKRGGA